jgi:hypothetical protein
VDPQRGTPWERRSWHDASRDCWRPDAPMRAVRDDGVRPPYIDYGTGRTTKGAKAPFS